MSAVFQVVVFDKTTGQILSAGTTCSPELLKTPTQGVLFGVSASAEHDYISGNTVRSKGAQPTPAHVFDYATKQWVDRRTPDDLMDALRIKRNALLAKSDWVVLRAQDQGAPVPPDWQAYRQALRDITAQSDPATIVWPQPPG